MMTICQSCGYESTISARFCRQCGALLSGEGDPTDAPTRNYGRPEGAGSGLSGAGTWPGPSPVVSGPLSPSIGDAFTGTTARYPHPPAPQYMPPTAPVPVWAPPAAPTSRLKRVRKRLLLGGAMIAALLIAGGIGAAINDESNRGRVFLSRADQLRLDRMRREDDMKRVMYGTVEEMADRLNEDMQQRLNDLERAREEAQRAFERGTLAATDEKPLNLDAYEYENAPGAQESRIAGKEMTKQQSRDNFEAISDFYQKKLGAPVLVMNERNNRRVIFQTKEKPSVTVLLEENRERRGQTEITILRSPFPFPTLEAETSKPVTATQVAPPPPPPAAPKAAQAPER